MLWRRRRERAREAGRRARVEVFARLDDLERKAVAYQAHREAEGAKAASSSLPPMTARQQADLIVDLARTCDRDVSNVLFLVEAWKVERERAQSRSELEQRRYEVVSLWVVRTIGNLTGLIPEDTASFRPDLAAEGKRLRWRR